MLLSLNAFLIRKVYFKILKICYNNSFKFVKKVKIEPKFLPSTHIF